MINSFLLAFAMYSRVPMPGPDWEKEKMKYVMVFLPVVGAVVGAVFWGFGALCAYLSLPGLFRAAGLTAIPLVVTGGIHMDGFLDTADALASCQDRERKLEILKDSRTGAFAVIKGGLYLVCSLGVWSALPERLLPVAAVGFVFLRGRGLRARRSSSRRSFSKQMARLRYWLRLSRALTVMPVGI